MNWYTVVALFVGALIQFGLISWLGFWPVAGITALSLGWLMWEGYHAVDETEGV